MKTRTVYEVEVHFIGELEFYYFYTRKDAEKCADFINQQPAESAFFGQVKATARIHEVILQPNQYIDGQEIVTTYRRA